MKAIFFYFNRTCCLTCSRFLTSGGVVMQISEKSIQETIKFIVDTFRRRASECSTDTLLNIDYYDASSKLQGLRLLFINHPGVIALIDAAMLETDQIREAGKARLVSGQMAA